MPPATAPRPVALFSLMHLAQVGRYCLGLSGVTATDLYELEVYFRPRLLVGRIAGLPTYSIVSSALSAFGVEAAKWCIVLAIAVRLSIAQLGAWRQRKKKNPA